jgi:hypothetical protein
MRHFGGGNSGLNNKKESKEMISTFHLYVATFKQH